MEKEKYISVITGWMEKFPFSGLTKEQKEAVLHVMTATEYEKHRETINRSKEYFSQDNAAADNSRIYNALIHKLRGQPEMNHVLLSPIPVYKAAIIIIIVFLMGLLPFLLSSPQKEYYTRLITDTAYVSRIDTLKILVRDTVFQYLTRISTTTKPEKENQRAENHPAQNHEHPVLPANTIDCSRYLCPGDMKWIDSLQAYNALKYDSLFDGMNPPAD